MTDYVRRTRSIPLPTLDLNFKVIRDLLIHPYADKSISGEMPGTRRPITQGDVFDVSIDDAKLAVHAVDRWLGAVTEMFEYPRGYDTQRLAEDFAKRLTGHYKALTDAGGIDDLVDVTAYRI